MTPRPMTSPPERPPAAKFSPFMNFDYTPSIPSANYRPVTFPNLPLPPHCIPSSLPAFMATLPTVYGGDFPTSTEEELHAFYSMERNLYSIMVNDFYYNPIEALKLLALLLWLERNCFGYVVAQLVGKPMKIIKEITSAALICLHFFLNDKPVPDSGHLRSLRRVLNQEITLDFFCQNHERAVTQVELILQRVCIPAVDDILKKALENPDRKKQGPRRWPEGRTMFMTFSKGYPVEEWEVWEVMAARYGADTVESIHMAETTAVEPQSLNAHIVLRSADSVNRILGGDLKRAIRFSIHGKDARLRKYDHHRRK